MSFFLSLPSSNVIKHAVPHKRRPSKDLLLLRLSLKYFVVPGIAPVHP